MSSWCRRCGGSQSWVLVTSRLRLLSAAGLAQCLVFRRLGRDSCVCYATPVKDRQTREEVFHGTDPRGMNSVSHRVHHSVFLP